MFGFQSFNDDNFVQLDSNFINFSVLSRGVTKSGSVLQPFNNYQSNMLIIRPPNGYIGYMHPVLYQSAVYPRGMFIWDTSSGGNPNIQWAAVAPANIFQPTDEDYGLQIFTPDGEVGFDSRQVQATMVYVNRVSRSGSVNLPPLDSGFQYYFLSNSVATLGFTDYEDDHEYVDVLEAGFTSNTTLVWRYNSFWTPWGGVSNSFRVRNGEDVIAVFKVAT